MFVDRDPLGGHLNYQMAADKVPMGWSGEQAVVLILQH